MKNPIPRSAKAALLRQKAQQQSTRGHGLKSFRNFLAAARLGDEEAQVTIGYDYAYGSTGNANGKKALYWWKRAYKKGSWAAAFNLGMYFRDAKQWKKALKWFDRALQAGDHDALVEIAKIHLRYGGDRAAGLTYLQRAADAVGKLTLPARLVVDEIRKQQASVTPIDVLITDSELLDGQGRFAEALPLLLEGANAGDSGCQINLANYLFNGRKGVPANQERAIHWYKKAYENGDSTGAHNLALSYRRIGNDAAADHWYALAVELGDLESHLSIAKIALERGNKEEAIQHLKLMFSGCVAVAAAI